MVAEMDSLAMDFAEDIFFVLRREWLVAG